MRDLQTLVDTTPSGGTLTLGDEIFEVLRPVVVRRHITIVGGRLVVPRYARERFLPLESVVVITSRAHVRQLRIAGPGRRRDHLAGIRVTGAPGTTLENCHVENIEYALYFIDQSDGSFLVGCTGKQDPATFSEPWNGLDYGVVIQASRQVVIRECRILATRHAVVTGHQSRGTIVDSCLLMCHADVQTLAMKPTSADGRVLNSHIVGGVNIGGSGQWVQGNLIVGRSDRPQPSTPVYCPRSTIRDFNHDVVDNTVVVPYVQRGSSTYGAVYVNLPGGRGEFRLSNNRFFLDSSDIPVVVDPQKRVTNHRNTTYVG